MIEFGHGTHIGLRRDHNEDTYQADSSAGLWLVADGMGGHEHGEVASAIARDTISAQIANGTDLVEAIREADRAIMAVSHARDGNLPMGTTVAALKITANRYQVAWVGDSRVYLADTDLQQLSRDHSFVRQLVDRGAISEDEARRGGRVEPVLRRPRPDRVAGHRLEPAVDAAHLAVGGRGGRRRRCGRPALPAGPDVPRPAS